MIFESSVRASAIDANGSFKPCAELCSDCPRRSGTNTTRASGWRGWIGKKISVPINSDPLKSGVLRSYQTNGRHGVFYGNASENTGTVAFLRQENASTFIAAVLNCKGPVVGGNVCRALGATSRYANQDLDASMQEAIDAEPLDLVLESLAADSPKALAEWVPDTEVFMNKSRVSDTAA